MADMFLGFEAFLSWAAYAVMIVFAIVVAWMFVKSKK